MDIVTRDQWGCASPPAPAIPTPTAELVLHHLAAEQHGPEGMRAVDRYHREVRGYVYGIAYSFCVDDDGTCFEGRGAGALGAHTAGHNTSAHAICLMGHFGSRAPTQAAILATARLVAHGHRSGWWPAQITHGHRDLGTTSCPGDHAYRAIPDINFLARSERLRTEPQEDDMPLSDDDINRIIAGVVPITVAATVAGVIEALGLKPGRTLKDATKRAFEESIKATGVARDELEAAVRAAQKAAR